MSTSMWMFPITESSISRFCTRTESAGSSASSVRKAGSAFTGSSTTARVRKGAYGGAVSGVISYGTMLAGLLTGAGVGVLVLFKVNKRRRENLTIILLLVVLGTLFGTLAELLPLA